LLSSFAFNCKLRRYMKAVLSATMPPNARGTGFAISALTQGLALGRGSHSSTFQLDLSCFQHKTHP
jgi:hypothetical protein